jgi:hypothetical protein
MISSCEAWGFDTLTRNMSISSPEKHLSRNIVFESGSELGVGAEGSVGSLVPKSSRSWADMGLGWSQKLGSIYGPGPEIQI